MSEELTKRFALWYRNNLLSAPVHQSRHDRAREAFMAGAEAQALTAAQPAQAGEIGSEWQACVKMPVTVHVRKQRQGEAHVSTREGITPIKPDDLIMRGVSGEEYPIGRDIFEQTYRLAPTQPAQAAQVPEGWRDAKNDPPPVGVDVLVAVEFDRPGDWRIKVGGRNPQERTGWCVFGASWVPQVWMPLNTHRAMLTAAQQGAEHE